MTTNGSPEQIKVLLFGLGAIGGFYAFILGKNPNVSLSVIARSNYEAVKQNGLQIESHNHGNHKVNIGHVFKSPSEAPFKFDYVVCAHKAINPSSIPPIFNTVTSDSTTFVMIQNGVGNEEPFRQTYPNNTIISCVTWTGAVQSSPGLIKHNPNEDMQIGLYPNPALNASTEKQRLDLFADLLTNGGTKFSVEENIQIKRWEKVVWNAAWNPLTTLTGVEVQTYLKSSPEAMRVTRQLMQEMVDIAQACQVPLSHDLVEVLIDKVLAMPPIFSSMYVDSQEGRPLEMEVIVGTPMRKANEFGMQVPVLRTIYSLTAAVNQRLSKS